MIKEGDVDELSASLNGSRISQLLACHQAELSVQSEATANQTVDLSDVNEAVKITKKEEMDAFSSKIMHSQTKAMFLGNNMHVIMQSLRGVKGPTCLTP